MFLRQPPQTKTPIYSPQNADHYDELAYFAEWAGYQVGLSSDWRDILHNVLIESCGMIKNHNRKFTISYMKQRIRSRLINERKRQNKRESIEWLLENEKI